MKYLLVALGFLMGIGLAIGGFVHATQPKITICHATSSEENPWVRIVVSENATGGHFENNGTPKAGHEDDVLLQGDVDCPTSPAPQPSPEPSPGPTPEPTPAPNPSPTEGGEATPVTLPQVGADGK